MKSLEIAQNHSKSQQNYTKYTKIREVRTKSHQITPLHMITQNHELSLDISKYHEIATKLYKITQKYTEFPPKNKRQYTRNPHIPLKFDKIPEYSNNHTKSYVITPNRTKPLEIPRNRKKMLRYHTTQQHTEPPPKQPKPTKSHESHESQ